MTLQTRKMEKSWILTAVLIAAMLLIIPAIAFAEGDDPSIDDGGATPVEPIMVGAEGGAPPKVELGTAEDFAVLAGETITNTGPTTITGDIGLHPGSAITGYDEITHTGELQLATDAAEQAKEDLVIAYNDAAGRPVTSTIGVELGNKTLLPGVYNSLDGYFQITGTLTLHAESPNDAFIFQMKSTLETATDSRIELTGLATFCQVFWQVGSSATLGANSTFVGHILALTSIEVLQGAKIEGQLLARNGSVTLINNTIINETCEADTDATTDGNGTGTYNYDYTGSEATLLGTESLLRKGTDTGALAGDKVALPATGGLVLAQIFYALGGAMMTVGGIMLKRKVK